MPTGLSTPAKNVRLCSKALRALLQRWAWGQIYLGLRLWFPEGLYLWLFLTYLRAGCPSSTQNPGRAISILLALDSLLPWELGKGWQGLSLSFPTVLGKAGSVIPGCLCAKAPRASQPGPQEGY